MSDFSYNAESEKILSYVDPNSYIKYCKKSAYLTKIQQIKKKLDTARIQRLFFHRIMRKNRFFCEMRPTEMRYHINKTHKSTPKLTQQKLNNKNLWN